MSAEEANQSRSVTPTQDQMVENPSALLEGLVLKNGWRVVEKINLSGETTEDVSSPWLITPRMNKGNGHF
jgi:hypothetical protein